MGQSLGAPQNFHLAELGTKCAQLPRLLPNFFCQAWGLVRLINGYIMLYIYILRYIMENICIYIHIIHMIAGY